MEYAGLGEGRFGAGRVALQCLDRMLVAPVLRRQVERGVSAMIAWRRPAPTAGPAERAAAAVLLDRGLFEIGALLAPEDLARVHVYLAGKPAAVVAPQDARDGNRIAGYPLEVVLECPHLVELAHHPAVLAAAGAYIGCQPTIVTWGLRWSFPGQGRPATTQRFHRDREGWFGVKLFVYLTEVDERAGPHVYACGSHRGRASMRARLYSDDEAVAQVGGGNITAVTGPAGHGFLTDPYGLHKGMVPTARPRLILQVHYAALPSPVYRYRPIRIARRPAGIDPYVNRLFVTG